MLISLLILPRAFILGVKFAGYTLDKYLRSIAGIILTHFKPSLYYKLER